MAELGYLASAAVAGVLLLVVWRFVTGMENWRSYDFSTASASDSGDSVGAWIAVFVLLALVVGGGAVLLVSGSSMLSGVGAPVVVAGLFGVVLLGYLAVGTYSSARSRGLDSAKATLLSAWLLGALGLVAITVKLLTGA